MARGGLRARGSGSGSGLRAQGSGRAVEGAHVPHTAIPAVLPPLARQLLLLPLLHDVGQTALKMPLVLLQHKPQSFRHIELTLPRIALQQ
jgi:hypothetical protein